MPTLAEKQQALEVLIHQSVLLAEDKKPELIAKIPQMAEADLDSLGQFLALEVKNAEKFYEENLPKLEKLIGQLNKFSQVN